MDQVRTLRGDGKRRCIEAPKSFRVWETNAAWAATSRRHCACSFSSSLHLATRAACLISCGSLPVGPAEIAAVGVAGKIAAVAAAAEATAEPTGASACNNQMYLRARKFQF